MDETYNLTAIVLNRRPYAEDDGRVTVYSLERGKLDLTVRGLKKIKSKLAGHLEPMTLVDIMAVRGRRHDYAGAAVSQECFGRIKNDLDKLTIAGQAVGVFNKLVKAGEADQGLFALLKDFLQLLNLDTRCPLDAECLNSFFILKLLVELGYRPELDNCLGCGKKIMPGHNFFNPAKGGLFCSNCPSNSGSLEISDDAIKLLRLAISCKLAGLIKIKISDRLEKEIMNIVNCFFQYYQG
ncbi:MAG: DNA repair protein RecO [bacterium]|nr:DNA repair protein RecO [bacterium]